MKSFKFRYSLTVWILLAVVVVSSAIGLAWNIYNVIFYNTVDAFKTASYIIIALLTLALLILSLSIILYGKYVIKKEHLVSYFGFIKTKILLTDITEVVHFKKSDKLVAYFKDDSFTVIVISPEEYSNFVIALREVNPQIYYGVKIDGEDTPN